jgi:hypothetical protein
MVRRKSGNLVADVVCMVRVVPVITLRHFPISPLPHTTLIETMVYLPSPRSPAPESGDPSTDSQRGPSEPDRVPPRLNGQSVVQSHHDDPVANQIAPATDQHQNQIQSLQSNSSPRISHESVRLSLFKKPRNESDDHTSFWFAPIIGDAPGNRSNQVWPSRWQLHRMRSKWF